MLSKCLNPNCSAKFHSLGQGRLFRIDFTEVGRRSAQSGHENVLSFRKKGNPIEHFWLCESCAVAMTIGLTDAGDVRLVALGVPVPNAVGLPSTTTPRAREAAVS